MGAFNFSRQTFLIVDDIRLCRINVMEMLKNCGEPALFHTENGHAAISLLSEPNAIHCVICDFNMPVMHGLQLVKAIRTGFGHIRRNLPIIMLTGLGDRNLVGLAMALDVNAFIMKPVKKTVLLERIQRILSLAETGGNELKSISVYEEIDVDAPIHALLHKPKPIANHCEMDQLSQPIDELQEKHHFRNGINSNFVQTEKLAYGCPETMALPSKSYALDEVPINAVLARDLYGNNGQKILSVNQKLTNGMLGRLRDLREMGESLGEIYVRMPAY
jgi:DNA-binding NarL/FixJ family response regulator